MEPDKYQQAWQEQTSETRITVDADLLLEAVRRNQRNFRTAIFWRDFTEVVVALVLIPLWFYLGLTLPFRWTWWLTVPVLVWMAGFMLVYRRRHKPKPTQPDEPLVDCAQNSLTELEAQIWLLRNVLWWYLLPPFISLSAFFVETGWSMRAFGGWQALVFVVFLEVFLAVLYGFLYFLNQYAVRAKLEPKRRELLALLASLRGEPAGKVTGQYPILVGAKDVTCSPRRRLLRFGAAMTFLIAALILIGLFAHSVVTRHDSPRKSPFAAVRWQGSQPEVKVGDEWLKLVSLDGIPASEIVAFSQRTYGTDWQRQFEENLVELPMLMGHPPLDNFTFVLEPLKERSPFAAVRWQGSQPEVKVGGEWFKLVSLDGIPASEIVAFSRRTFGNDWRMRFEEDLVVLLTRMGHPPGDTVTLCVESLKSSETRTLKDVPMTSANRWAIKREAILRRRTSQP